MNSIFTPEENLTPDQIRICNSAKIRHNLPDSIGFIDRELFLIIRNSNPFQRYRLCNYCQDFLEQCECDESIEQFMDELSLEPEITSNINNNIDYNDDIVNSTYFEEDPYDNTEYPDPYDGNSYEKSKEILTNILFQHVNAWKHNINEYTDDIEYLLKFFNNRLITKIDNEIFTMLKYKRLAQLSLFLEQQLEFLKPTEVTMFATSEEWFLRNLLFVKYLKGNLSDSIKSQIQILDYIPIGNSNQQDCEFIYTLGFGITKFKLVKKNGGLYLSWSLMVKFGMSKRLERYKEHIEDEDGILRAAERRNLVDSTLKSDGIFVSFRERFNSFLIRLGCSSSQLAEAFIKKHLNKLKNIERDKKTKVGLRPNIPKYKNKSDTVFSSDEVFFIPIEKPINELVRLFCMKKPQIPNLINKFNKIYDIGKQNNHIIVSKHFINLINAEKPDRVTFQEYEQNIAIGKEKFNKVMYDLSIDRLFASDFCKLFISSSFITHTSYHKALIYKFNDMLGIAKEINILVNSHESNSKFKKEISNRDKTINELMLKIDKKDEIIEQKDEIIEQKDEIIGQKDDRLTKLMDIVIKYINIIPNYIKNQIADVNDQFSESESESESE